MELERRLNARFNSIDSAIASHDRMAKRASDKLIDSAVRQTEIMEETLKAVSKIVGIDWFKVARGAAFTLLLAVAVGVLIGKLGGDGIIMLIKTLAGHA
jgi:hypothetical protein